MTDLNDVLNEYRAASKNEREKGTYFEKLIQCYLKFEPAYAWQAAAGIVGGFHLIQLSSASCKF